MNTIKMFHGTQKKLNERLLSNIIIKKEESLYPFPKKIYYDGVQSIENKFSFIHCYFSTGYPAFLKGLYARTLISHSPSSFIVGTDRFKEFSFQMSLNKATS
jgi:hypothetical protein